ncbi:MAG: hypothetical protein FJ118_17960 [Deltaproteobacteria bacterium]|nr:hypothetical protein [Deltaproteobacteria bacterium]
MRKRHIFLLSVIVPVLLFACPSRAEWLPSFIDGSSVTGADGKVLPLGQLNSRFRVLINSFAYLLDRYLLTGDTQVAYRIRELGDAMELHVTTMGKMVETDKEKELFAKLLVGSRKLRENVAKNLASVEELRIIRNVFDRRSESLIDWLKRQEEELLLSGPTPEAYSAATILNEARINVLQAVFFNQVAARGTLAEEQRARARARWEAALEQAKLFSEKASGDRVRKTALALTSGLNAVKGLAGDLLIRSDEVSQAWEKTLALVESLDNMAKPPEKQEKASEQHAKPESPKKEGRPDDSRCPDLS